jgi:hypothetical protein
MLLVAEEYLLFFVCLCDRSIGITSVELRRTYDRVHFVSLPFRVVVAVSAGLDSWQRQLRQALLVRRHEAVLVEEELRADASLFDDKGRPEGVAVDACPQF